MKNGKGKVSYAFSVHIIFTIISLFILFKILQYLQEIESCPCFINKNNRAKYQTDISFLKFYQYLEIFALLLFSFVLLSYKYAKMGGRISGKNEVWLKGMVIISILLLFVISGYMTYSTITLYLNIDEDCKCVNRWQKYFVYLQGIVNSVNFLRLSVSGLLVMVLILFNFLKY